METEDNGDDNGWSVADPEGELTGLEPKFVVCPVLEYTDEVVRSFPIDTLISDYIALRNQLTTDRHGYEAREKRFKERMHTISMVLLQKGDELGVDNFKTQSGTAYRNKKESFRVGNWDALVAYIKQTGNFHVLQKRAAPNAVKEVRETDGEIPPGFESYVEVEFSVRSPTARSKKG